MLVTTTEDVPKKKVSTVLGVVFGGLLGIMFYLGLLGILGDKIK